MEAGNMKNNIKVLRSKFGFTQEELAEQLDVSRQTVIAIENNKYLPSLGLAFRIARAFDTHIEAVFMETDEERDGV